ncbi:hypothetical protein B296_00006258 [Ensete ventricosum]|uniref:Uncharacterized protein n=1 Tax=Ensete ventricosum TaxID=4639 RepID=A0A426ZB59_ENSVE|nr:hypothetical protein B296_00006258 [Ensete ventricosum]
MHTIRRSRHSRAPTIPLHNNTTLTSFVPVSRFPFRGCVGPRNASSKRPGIRRVSAGCVSVIDIARYGLVRQLTLTSPRPRRAPRQEPYLVRASDGGNFYSRGSDRRPHLPPWTAQLSLLPASDGQDLSTAPMAAPWTRRHRSLGRPERSDGPLGCQCATCCSAPWAHRSPPHPIDSTHPLTRLFPHGLSLSLRRIPRYDFSFDLRCERRRCSTPHRTSLMHGMTDDRIRVSDRKKSRDTHTLSLSLSAWKQRTLYRGRLYLTDRLYPGVLWLEKGTFFGWDPIRGWVIEKGEGRTYGLVSWKIKT